MNEETIHKIAVELFAEFHVLPLLLLQMAVTAAAAGIAAFFGEYLKTRGKNLATKADFESLKGQLRANTELVETIKAEVGQKDWARREWTSLRRIKLEALLERMHDCHAFLDLYRSKSIRGEVVGERDPIGELETIAVLYLPEIKREALVFVMAHRDQIVALNCLGLAMVAAGQNPIDRTKAFEEFNTTFNPSDVLQAAAALTVAARMLLVKIVDVEDTASGMAEQELTVATHVAGAGTSAVDGEGSGRPALQPIPGQGRPAASGRAMEKRPA